MIGVSVSLIKNPSIVKLTEIYNTDSEYDSLYKTGQHAPFGQNRHPPLTSVATNASESRVEVSSPYFEDASTSALNSTAYGESPTTYARGTGPQFPSPYSPGMRSAAASQQITSENFENSTPGEIPMQAFQEGLPPPPPCSYSWRKIDMWAEEHYEELFDQLGEGCTTNDLNELEYQLDCSLPLEVRESLQIHDGQEQGGRPTGIIFGSMLLDCEEIVHEWRNWRLVNQEYLTEPTDFKPSTPLKVLGGGSSSSKNRANASRNPLWRQELLARQDSQPPNAIQKAYAHPAWIPLVRDWGGNNLAVDLAPGPAGNWGQVILIGRDYDCKYVVARSWSALLAMVADDLNSGKWFIDEDTNELKLREFKASNVEPGYFDILRWRVDQKFGRRGVRKRSAGPANATSGGSPISSPYASPSAQVNAEPRGRSMQRFSGASPVASPNRPNYGTSSPLARVKEEIFIPTEGQANSNSSLDGKLVEIATPRPSDEEKRSKALETLLEPATLDGKVEKTKIANANLEGLEIMNGDTKRATMKDDDGVKIKPIDI